MDIRYEDREIVVAVKQRGVLSEYHASEENMVTLLGGKVYPVHRLDRAVGGLMVYAKTRTAAAALSRAVQEDRLKKGYTAIVAGRPTPDAGEMRDLLFKDSAANKSFVVKTARKGAKEALLSYRVTDTKPYLDTQLSRVEIELKTGRSHQIRVQFSSRGSALFGDGKYGSRHKAPYPALYATSLGFPHPTSGEMMQFSVPVPAEMPWSLFGTSAYEIERKYLIAYPDVAVLTATEGCRIKQITQTYLLAPAGETLRVRRVAEGGRVVYIETCKRRVSELCAVEEERELCETEYEALLRTQDPTRRPIEKTRYCVPYEGKTVEVDVYAFWQDRATAEIELTSETEAAALPPYLHVIREVSADPRYKNVNLARELPVDL